MNPVAKIAKYFAYGLAGIIIVSILAAIVSVFCGFLTVVGLIGGKAPELNVDCAEYDTCLALSIGAAKVEIKQGDELSYSSDIKDLEVSLGDQKLVIKDKSKVRWFNSNNKTITVTVPKDMNFDMIGIASGAGELTAERLVAKKANLKFGAGKTTLNYLEVTDSAEINAGVGKFTIEDGAIHDAKISLEVGKTDIKAKLTGSSDVNCSVGSVNLQLLLAEDEYTIRTKKGIGSIHFNGNDISNNAVIGNGKNVVNIKGDVGSIDITTDNTIHTVKDLSDSYKETDRTVNTDKDAAIDSDKTE